MTLFHNMARNTIIRFQKLLKEKKFTHGEVVYAQGENCKNVYIVKFGEFELVRQLPQHQIEKKKIVNIE